MTGSVTISVEIELAWGFHDRAPPEDVEFLSLDGRAERKALGRFLELLDEKEVPATFDVVGHLLLEECDGDHDGPHPEGWFQRDPGTNTYSDPLYYFPELEQMIHSSELEHEICTHTYSHVLCDEVDDDVIEWEIERARDIHDEDILSFVAPRHRKAPNRLLRDNGIDVVRRPVDDARPTDPIRQFIWTFRRTQPVAPPTQEEGVVESPVSSIPSLTATHLSRGEAPPHPAFRMVPEAVRQRLHQRFLVHGVEEAVERESHTHYWTHLYNLTGDVQWPPLETFLERLSEDDVEVLRMCDLVREVESSS